LIPPARGEACCGGVVGSGDQVRRLWILRFLRLRRKARVKVSVNEGVKKGIEFRLSG